MRLAAAVEFVPRQRLECFFQVHRNLRNKSQPGEKVSYTTRLPCSAVPFANLIGSARISRVGNSEDLPSSGSKHPNAHICGKHTSHAAVA